MKTSEQRRRQRERVQTGAYTVQVEGVGLAGSVGGHGEGDLNSRVGGDGVDTAVGEELRRGERATEDLEQHGDGRGREGLVVDVEVGAIEAEVEVERVVDAADFSRAGRGEVLERDEVGLVQRVVMMRHALAPGTGDPPSFKLGDCSTQRNLSAEGRKQAVQLGKEFRDRNIRIARVLSSQWCRCLDTAKLMDLGKVEPFPALNSFFQNPSMEAKQTAAVRQFIINNRNTQGVIVMVTHQVNITALTGVVPQSGESVVLRASEQGQVEVVGRLPVL